jgi:acyl carrier protein
MSASLPHHHLADSEALHKFLRENVPAATAAELTVDTPLLGQGLLDSLGVIQLMVFLGNELGLEVLDEDFTPENLATLGSVLAFIGRKRESSLQGTQP